MQDYEITCVTQYKEVITHVGFNRGKYPVQSVVGWILNGTYAFHTYKAGQRAHVYAKQSVNGNWFLTTDPDSTKENNLDFLPACNY